MDNALVVMTRSDPANVWTLPLDGSGAGTDAFARARGARTILVTLRGRVILTADARARTFTVRPDLDAGLATAAVREIVRHVSARRPRDFVVETIDGENAATSRLAGAFLEAGLRRTTAGLRYYASFNRG
jgi:hypothetical protein